MTNRFWIIVFVLLHQCVLAQYKFSADPAVFVTEVNTMMANTKNPQAIQIAATFATTFPTYSADHQKKIIESSQKLSKTKKLRAHPQFSDYFAALSAAKTKNLSTANIDTLLLIFNHAADKYETKALQDLVLTLHVFLEQGYLYKSNYNSLRFTGGDFSFRLVQAKEPDSFIDDFDKKLEEQNNPDTTKKSTLDAQKDFFSDWDVPAEEETGFGTIEDEQTEQDILDVGYNYPAQPPLDGALIQFKKADLVFVTPNDSNTLKGTDGSLLLKNNVFVGKGGTMDWHAAGLPSTEVWAVMREFNFPIKTAKMMSEGAILHYPSKADSTVEGIFEFKENKAKDVQYPRFKSFKSNVEVKGFDQNIRYRGGFSMSGRHIYSSSLDEGFASIYIMKDGKPRVSAFSPRFELGDSLITTNYARLTLYIDDDSITHPGTVIKYNKKTQNLHVTKQPGFNYAPFIDTYHQLEIIADAIQWDMNKPQIDITIINAKNHVPATFESGEFFHSEKFFKLKGLYRFHPLQVVSAYSDKVKATSFYANEVAESNKLDVNTFKGAMIQLMKLGYIDYNVRSGLIQMRPKARHYVLSSRNKKDYDNVTFVSLSPSGVNASLDLESHELHVRGVDRIYISDSLKVNLTPDNKEIKIEKNRNFKFSGVINTETFQFVGKDFHFVYDSFLVHMPQIDQIRLAVSTKKKTSAKEDAQTSSKSRVLGNELRYSSGTLYINKPNNKSARKKFSQYPIFDATSGASVFFDKKNINGGAYDTTIKFEIPPFRLDSLSSDDPHSIGFEGTFKSGGIFPEFKEKLVVMPDFSLGFKHKVPQAGYPLYSNGVGTYYSTITMDNKGIRGEGEIKYLTTQLYSKDFIFFKDSVKTEGTRYITKAGTHPDALQTVHYPLTKATDYRLRWLPYQDSMFVSNSKTPLIMYDSTATMQGTVNIRKTEMLGKGVLFTRGSITESRKFSFQQTNFTAREAKFQIESEDPDKPAVLGLDDKVEFDLEKRMVHFSPEKEGAASNSFPYVEYRSSLQDAVWDLDKKNVTLSVKDSVDLNRFYFYSTQKDQDSLVFNATGAVYDIPKQVMNISGVPFIHVADAKIFPDSNRVRVEQNALMTTLRKAKIEVDTTHKYHHLYDGTIDIKSRQKFEGIATYRYVNLGDDTLAISFQDFRTEPGRKKKEGMHTVATGLVKEDDELFIGPKIIYKGKVTMYAESPYLVFDGYIKLDLKGALSYSEWLKYNNDGETKEVKIDLKNAVSDNGTPLSTGMHLDKRTNQLYTTFISKKVNQTDPDFFVADRAFEFDLDSNEFRVGNVEKFHHKSQEGNNLVYNDTRSTVRSTGKYTFLHLSEKDENVKIIMGGDGRADINKTDYSFQVLMSFLPKLHVKIMDAIGKDLKGVSQMVIDTLPDSTTFDPMVMAREEEIMVHKVAAVAGNSGVQKYKDGKATGAPMLNLNSEFAKAFLFSNVKFKWSPAYKAFYSVGKIKVESVMKNEIKKAINGYIEIRKGSKGDKITVYLEPTENSWYYITYDENRLAALSSSDVVMKNISGRAKGEMPDRGKFFFVAAEAIEKQKFLVDFRNHYLGTAEEHHIDEEEETPKEETPKEETPKEEIDISEPEIGTDTPEETTPPPTNTKDKKKSSKKKKEPTYDQYKLPDQPEDTQVPDAEEEKAKPTIEDQKKLKDDQQKMKDLFK